MQHTEPAINGTNLHRVSVTDDADIMRAAQNARASNGVFAEFPEDNAAIGWLKDLAWAGAVLIAAFAAMFAIVLLLTRTTP